MEGQTRSTWRNQIPKRFYTHRKEEEEERVQHSRGWKIGAFSRDDLLAFHSSTLTFYSVFSVCAIRPYFSKHSNWTLFGVYFVCHVFLTGERICVCVCSMLTICDISKRKARKKKKWNETRIRPPELSLNCFEVSGRLYMCLSKSGHLFLVMSSRCTFYFL